MILYSDFQSSRAFLESVLPGLVGAGYTCVIKPHPAAGLRSINLKDHALAEEYTRTFENAIWFAEAADSAQQAALLATADLVVTTNSSLGFEATLYDKVVCVEGAAAFAPNDVFPTVRSFLEGEFDATRYLEQLASLRPFLIDCTLHEKQRAFRLEYFLSQITGVIGCWEAAGHDPEKYAGLLVAMQSFKVYKSGFDSSTVSQASKSSFGIRSWWNLFTNTDNEPLFLAIFPVPEAVLPTSELYGLFPKYERQTSCSIRMGDAFRVGDALVAVRCSAPSGWDGPVHALIDDDIDAIIRDEFIPSEYRGRLERAWRSSEILANLDRMESIAVPSARLESIYKGLGKKIVRLDPSWPVPLVRIPRARSGFHDVAFLGTGSHLQDLELLRDALVDSMRAWTFHHFLGKNAPVWMRGLPRIRAHSTSNWHQYRNLIGNHRFDL